MICERASRDAPWACREDDGAPIPADDPRVSAHAAAFESATDAPVVPLAPIAPPDVPSRQTACQACPHARLDVDRCRLMSCGCALSGRWLSPFASCPAGRWSAAARPTPTP